LQDRAFADKLSGRVRGGKPMETKWLEDFVVLAECGSFSRAARQRNVTQPAFSRRIQALERWLGVELVDRSTYPTALTAAGTRFHEGAASILQQIYGQRAQLQAPQTTERWVAFGAPHSLATHFFPRLLARIERSVGPLRVRLIAENLHDSVETLLHGGSDFLIAFHVADQPLLLGADRVQFVVVGRDRLLPVCAPDADGAPLHRLDEGRGDGVPLLAYDRTSYLGRVVSAAVSDHRFGPTVYENALVDGLKTMAVAGRGVAWLPESAIAAELEGGRLVQAADRRWHMQADIRLYRRLGLSGNPFDEIWHACTGAADHAVSA
jgi:DNA-binding transcriptional LysR family regulator